MDENQLEENIKTAQATLKKAQDELTKVKSLNITDDIKQELIKNGEINVTNAEENLKVFQEIKSGKLSPQALQEAKKNLDQMQGSQDNNSGPFTTKNGHIIYTPKVSKETIKTAQGSEQKNNTLTPDNQRNSSESHNSKENEDRPFMTREEYRRQMKKKNK